jgi:hypothetical protein
MAEGSEETAVDHGQYRRAIENVARADSGIWGFDPEMIFLSQGDNKSPEELVPLETRNVPGVGTVLVVAKSPLGDLPPVDLEQEFACLVLLRDATEDEIEESWSAGQTPKYVELLEFQSGSIGFLPTGQREGFVLF